MKLNRLDISHRIAFPAREAIAHTNPWMTLLPYWRRLWAVVRDARSPFSAGGSSH